MGPRRSEQSSAARPHPRRSQGPCTERGSRLERWSPPPGALTSSVERSARKPMRRLEEGARRWPSVVLTVTNRTWAISRLDCVAAPAEFCERRLVISRLVRALCVAAVMLGAAPAAAPAVAGSGAIFIVTAPSGTYAASTAEHAYWARIARRSGATRRQARWSAFELLLSFAWLEGEATERGLTVSARAVHREFVALRRQAFPSRRDFRQYLHDTGQTVADVERRVRLDLLANMIRDQVVARAAASVTDAQVQAYIAEHGLERVPERRDIRLVLTRRRRPAVEAKRELLRGRSWRSVARRYSIDEATRHRGGRLPGLARGTLSTRVERAVFRAPRGRVRGPLRTRVGFWVFTVTRIQPAHFRSVAASRRIVRRRLIRRAAQAELDRFVAALDTTWTSRTVCADRYRSSPNCANHQRAAGGRRSRGSSARPARVTWRER
jgi:foldase protein PrsA